jgi:serine/threonine protein kinase
MQQLGGMLGLFCGPQQTTQLDTVHKVSVDAPSVDSTDATVDRAAEKEALPEARVVVPLTASVLREGMDASAAGILPWDGRRFRRVKQLQEAKRNHGCVELMREGGTFVAVKKMPTRWIRGSPDEFDSRYPDASERPWMDVGLVRRLNELRFPYSVKLLGVFADHESTYVVSSLASEGDLFAWCDCDPKPGLKREAAMYPLVNQIFVGVRWLHDLGIAHRDLSLENLLLHNENGDLRIKIIDFGMSTLDAKATAEIRGKQSYQAPEIHLPQPFDTIMTDPFSLGVVLFAMGAQDYPWSSTKRKTCELFEYVCMFGFTKFLSKRRLRKGGGESLAEVFSPNFTALLVGLLAKDAGKRLTLGEKCFETPEHSSDRRTSVWDCRWMQQPLVATTEGSMAAAPCGAVCT